jgi:hypothetical protein
LKCAERSKAKWYSNIKQDFIQTCKFFPLSYSGAARIFTITSFKNMIVSFYNHSRVLIFCQGMLTLSANWRRDENTVDNNRLIKGGVKKRAVIKTASCV